MANLILGFNSVIYGCVVPLDGHVENRLEHSARITTFIITFVSIFCGWPCLLHFMAGFARTGVVLSSVTGCLVFQSAVLVRAAIVRSLTGQRHQISLHDLTEAVLVTASFNIRHPTNLIYFTVCFGRTYSWSIMKMLNCYQCIWSIGQKKY